MVLPTTLNCGHTTCRHCLANWVTASKKTICPLCRQPFVGIPRTNVTIRKTIEHFFPDRHSERQREVEGDENVKNVLADFEDTLAKQLKRNEGNILTGGCCFGAFLVVSLGCCFWFGSSLMNVGEADYLQHKPVPKWTAADVGLYVASLGAWAEPYAPRFVARQLTGTVVGVLDDGYLEHELQISDLLHRKSLLHSFSQLLTTGIAKVPASLWEYRALYPGHTLFLLYGFVHCPRTTLLYLYYFNYEDVFLPLAHGCCTGSSNDTEAAASVRNTTTLTAQLSVEDWTTFCVKAILLPFVIFAEFAWDWMDVHYWLTWGTILTCFLLTISEAAALRRHLIDYLALRNAGIVWHGLRSGAKSSLVWMLVFFAMGTVWSITPKFVADALFYAELLYVPVWQLKQLFRNNFQQ